MIFIEQRASERRVSSHPSLAMVGNVVGLIRDISLGGCSFHYVRDRELDSVGSTEGRFLIVEPLGMSRVKVQVIDDAVASDGSGTGVRELRVRRVRFVSLSQKQREQLKAFLQSAKTSDIVSANECLAGEETWMKESRCERF